MTLAFVLIYLFFSKWEDFKTGYVQGYNNQTKAKP